MCGIVGVFECSGALPSAELFASCLNRLKRRGPDDCGVWHDQRAHLGHRRLSIVDLSPTGHQPMESAEGRFVIVFNGEIYNHRELRAQLQPPGGWRGSSDTETLLEAYRTWGVSCLHRLNGMFAFGIWDRVERQMFVARDRMGVKPLYFHYRSGVFAFASRPGVLTSMFGKVRGEIDTDALRAYLELGYIPAPLSLYRHIRKVRAGHYLLVGQAEPREVRYWDYRHISVDSTLTMRREDDLVDELEDLIQSSVRARLMSDVPLGAFLSGGVDSAMIVSTMKAVGVANPKAFTIRFNEPQYDEGIEAARIARHIGVEHITETLNVGDLLELLPTYVEEFDEPFADSSAFPTMAVARLARRHVTVALTGDASDELFGGYHYYRLAAQLATLNRWPAPARALLRRVARQLPYHRAKLVAGALERTSGPGIFNYLRGFAKDFPALLTTAALQSTASTLDRFEQAAAGFAQDLSEAEQGMRLDLGFMLSDGYLQKVDVATMSMSVEARCPFIDYRVVEWAMKLPLTYKIRGHQTKYLLKKALCRHLPADLVYRPKRGFGVPVAQWLRGPLREWAYGLVNDDALISRLPLDRTRLNALVELHMSGARDAHPLLWSVLMLLCFIARHERNDVRLVDIPAGYFKRAV